MILNKLSLLLLLTSCVTQSEGFVVQPSHHKLNANVVSTSSSALFKKNRPNRFFFPDDSRSSGEYANQKLELPDGNVLVYDELLKKGSDELVIYLPNLAEDRSSSRTVSGIMRFCDKRNKNFIVADWFGRGDSTGKLMEATLSRWRDDVITLLDNAAPDVKGGMGGTKAVIVGSQVGVWVAVLVALERPDLVRGIVGLGGDPDFTEDLLWAQLDEEVKASIMKEGFKEIEWGERGEVYPITSTLIEDGRENLVLRGGPKSLPITCPVRLIHCLEDAEVPPSTSIRLAECLESDNVTVTMPKIGLGTPYAAIQQCFDFSVGIELSYVG